MRLLDQQLFAGIDWASKTHALCVVDDKKLRKALTDFADDSRNVSPWAAKIYNDAIDRGKRHPHAARILAGAWVRVIWRCWQDHIAYDPRLHGGAMLIAA